MKIIKACSRECFMKSGTNNYRVHTTHGSYHQQKGEIVKPGDMHSAKAVEKSASGNLWSNGSSTKDRRLKMRY